MSKYDVIVIGSGPGGYVCAIRCAQLGFKTAIVEKYSTLGGTCLNVGCIPSKALLDSSERYHETVHSHADHGINVKGVKLDFGKMMGRVDDVIDQTCGGVKYLMDKNKVDVHVGHASFKDKSILTIKGAKETTEITGAKIIIATGSKPTSFPGMEIDKDRIISSTEALKLKEVPKHLIVIGAGVIGLELGSVYKRLGSKVSVVEYADGCIAMMDKELGKHLQRSLKKDGMEFHLSHQVSKVYSKGKKVTVEVDNLSQFKKILDLKFDRILFDNMSFKNLQKGVRLSKNFYETEASGGITLKNIKKISSSGVNRISVGQITHSAPAVNFKLEI